MRTKHARTPDVQASPVLGHSTKNENSQVMKRASMTRFSFLDRTDRPVLLKTVHACNAIIGLSDVV